MLAEVRYQVFVSSTYEDLRNERQQVTQSILEMGHLPAGMELFPASDLSQWELIKKVISESDYYIIVVGARYGSVNSATGLSFTEMEYDFAVSSGIPVLGFVRRNLDTVLVAHTDKDSEKFEKLLIFREKVLSKACLLYNDPSELGMQVMKSLTAAIRLDPRTGWVRADKARNEDDVVREHALTEALARSEKLVRKLQRKIRDISLPLPGLTHDDIAKGDDIYSMSIIYTDSNKQLTSSSVDISWNELLSVIGPQMYGYILRRPSSDQTYSFEKSLIEFIRLKVLPLCGNKQIRLMSYQIDAILIQFKQLGYIEIEEKEEEGRERFRGYTLTTFGEEYLTLLNVERVTN